MDDLEAITILNSYATEDAPITLRKNSDGDAVLDIPVPHGSLPPELEDAFKQLNLGEIRSSSAEKDWIETHITFHGTQNHDVKALVQQGLKVEDNDNYLGYDRDAVRKQAMEWLKQKSNASYNPLKVAFHQAHDGKDTMELEFKFDQEAFDKHFSDAPYAVIELKNLFREFGATDVYDSTKYNGGVRAEETHIRVPAMRGDKMLLNLAKLEDAGVKIPGMNVLRSAFASPSVTPMDVNASPVVKAPAKKRG